MTLNMEANLLQMKKIHLLEPESRPEPNRDADVLRHHWDQILMNPVQVWSTETQTHWNHSQVFSFCCAFPSSFTSRQQFTQRDSKHTPTIWSAISSASLDNPCPRRVWSEPRDEKNQRRRRKKSKTHWHKDAKTTVFCCRERFMKLWQQTFQMSL